MGDHGSLKLVATNGRARLRIALSNDGAGQCAPQAAGQRPGTRAVALAGVGNERCVPGCVPVG